MIQVDPFDLSFMSDTLMRNRALIHEAQVAYEKGDVATCDEKLLEAGAEAGVALRTLYYHPLWDHLLEEQQRRLERWDLNLTFLDELFAMFGYRLGSPVRDLTDLDSEELKRAVGLSEHDNVHRIAKTKKKISDLHETLKRLMDALRKVMQSNDFSQDVRDALRNQIIEGIATSWKVLAKGLAIGLMLPLANLAIKEFGPYAEELLRELQDQAHILPSVPMVLVGSLHTDITHWFNQVAAVIGPWPLVNRRRLRPTQRAGPIVSTAGIRPGGPGDVVSTPRPTQGPQGPAAENMARRPSEGFRATDS